MAGGFGEALQRGQQAGHGVSDHIASGNGDNCKRCRGATPGELRCQRCCSHISVANDRLASAQGQVAGQRPGGYVEGCSEEYEDVFGVIALALLRTVVIVPIFVRNVDSTSSSQGAFTLFIYNY